MTKHKTHPSSKYVQRKVAHMQRMGIAAGINEFGAAEPDWHKEKRQNDEKRVNAHRARNA